MLLPLLVMMVFVVNKPHLSLAGCDTTLARLPSELKIGCTVNAYVNINCVVKNVPNCVDSRSLTSTIKFFQVKDSAETSPGHKEESKLCDRYDVCKLDHDDGIIFAYLFFNISIEMVYETEHEKMTSVSPWIEFDIAANVKLLPLKEVSVSETNKRNMTITWSSPLDFAKDGKDVNITYTTMRDGWNTSKHVLVYEPFTAESYPMEVTLENLHPFTTYDICMTLRPNGSNLWSDPFCFHATTEQDVPKSSPLRSSDAFTVISPDSFTVYWKPLKEYEWNSPQDGRRYIFQEYDDEVGWTDRRNLNWKDVQTNINGVKAGVYFGVVAANNEGRAKNISVIKIPGAKQRIPGPTQINVVYEMRTKLLDITWESEYIGTATVFWCKQDPRDESCLTSIEWQEVDNSKLHSFSIPVNNFTEVKEMKFSVSLSRRDGSVTYRSGLQWQICILIKNEDSTNRLGSCELKQTINSYSDEDAVWAIAVAVVIVMVVVCGPIAIVIKMGHSRWMWQKKHNTLLHLRFPSDQDCMVSGIDGRADESVGEPSIDLRTSNESIGNMVSSYSNSIATNVVLIRDDTADSDWTRRLSTTSSSGVFCELELEGSDTPVEIKSEPYVQVTQIDEDKEAEDDDDDGGGEIEDVENDEGEIEDNEGEIESDDGGDEIEDVEDDEGEIEGDDGGGEIEDVEDDEGEIEDDDGEIEDVEDDEGEDKEETDEEETDEEETDEDETDEEETDEDNDPYRGNRHGLNISLSLPVGPIGHYVIMTED